MAYNSSQVSAYLTYINLPQKYHPSSSPAHDINFLTALHTHHITTIPYENLSLHYSTAHSITLDPQAIYTKIVPTAPGHSPGSHGRGGYCMESSILFNLMLRGLGFQAYTAGATIRQRVNGVPDGDYIGWVHVVNVVTLSDPSDPSGRRKRRYACDVAFGGDGAIKPLPMISGSVVQNIGSQEIRLIYSFIPQQSYQDENINGEDVVGEGGLGPAQKMWIYQYRNGKDKEWNSFFAFPELEFTRGDFQVMNWYTSQSPESFQTFTVLVVKFMGRTKGSSQSRSIDGEAETETEAPEADNAAHDHEQDQEREIYGKLMLIDGTVKRHLGMGKTEIVQTCETEEERREALKEWFGIELTDDEVQGNRGRVTELRPKGMVVADSG